MRQGVIGGLAALAVAASTARAQDACGEQLKAPAVGRWVEYEVTAEGKSPTRMRYAVVGQESRDGSQMRWIEMRLSGGKPDETVIYQMLVPGWPLDVAQVQEIVFKPGGQPAMRMSGPMLKMVRGSLEKGQGLKFSELCRDATLAGTERVTVPAGSFQARRYRSEKHRTDTWVTDEAAFGMVKTTSGTTQTVLVAQGDGAKSSITETPQEMGGFGPGE